MILLTVAATTLAALLYLAVADKVYEAEADLLVTPTTDDNQALTGLGLIRESNDPTRDVETAARLVLSRDVAERVRSQLRLDEDASDLLGEVSAEPVAQSNFVTITASADTPEKARDLANGFAEAVVADRTADLVRQLDDRLPRLRERVRAGEGAGDSGPDSPQAQLAQLEALRDGGDPTLRIETRAEAPSSPAAPRPVLTLVAAVIAGLILGIGGAFALHALDPVLRREEQLRELYSLPILARIPRERKARTFSRGKRIFFGLGPHSKRRHALAPSQLSPTTNEAFRTLRMMLLAGRGGAQSGGRTILVTGPSPSEGKTTTAINLASSFALAGNRVILIEADFRRPTVGEALRVRPDVGIGRVLLGTATLEEAAHAGPAVRRRPAAAARRPGRRMARGDTFAAQRPRAAGRGRAARGLRDHRLAAADRGHRRSAARTAGGRRGDRHAARLEQPLAPGAPGRPARPERHPAAGLRGGGRRLVRGEELLPLGPRRPQRQ